MSERVDARVEVTKALKLYVNGALIRSESGATFPVACFEVCGASRKDARDAVRAGANAATGWAARDAYNRGQVIYRVAEMFEARAGEFAALLQQLGVDPVTARHDVQRAVDVWVHYAGWSDKVGQVFGSVNDVSGPFVSYTSAQSLGLVAVLVDASTSLSLVEVSAALASTLAAGNAAVVCVAGPLAVLMANFAEVLATSDVPAGVVQVLTASRADAARTLAAASQVTGLDLTLAGEEASRFAVSASETFTRALTRTATRPVPVTGAARLRWQLERRTVWHPAAK